jgi:hypothetical protein
VAVPLPARAKKKPDASAATSENATSGNRTSTPGNTAPDEKIGKPGNKVSGGKSAGENQSSVKSKDEPR